MLRQLAVDTMFLAGMTLQAGKKQANPAANDGVSAGKIL